MSYADSPVKRTNNHDGTHSEESTLPGGNAPYVADVATESPRSPPHSAIGSSTPAHESPGRCLTHLDLNGVPCQGGDIPTSGTPTRPDAVPESPHGCPGHLTLHSPEGQDLEMVDATKPGAVASHAIRTATPMSSSQSPSDSSTSARTSQPLILAPLETVEVPKNGGCVALSAAPSRCSSIPRTRDTSSERQLSPETPQNQGLATTGCGSGDVEAQAYEAASGLSPGTQEASSPFQDPITRRRSRRIAAHKLTHNDDDSDGNAHGDSQGSEDDLDHTSLLRDEEHCPSVTAGEEEGQEGEISDEDEQCPRKRRRVSRFSTSLMHQAVAKAERPRRGRASLRSTAQSTKGLKRFRASGIPSPASSQATSTETELEAVPARFEELPLENLSLKRITENGETKFQLQFDWTPCIKHGHASSASWDRTQSLSTRRAQTVGKVKRASATRVRYTTAEDDLLIRLKEEERLAWPEIHQRFSERYPGRSVETLQVHYCTKLKSLARS